MQSLERHPEGTFQEPTSLKNSFVFIDNKIPAEVGIYRTLG
jgi:hypothetical protein